MLKVYFEFRFKGPHYDFKEGHLRAREISNIATGITNQILSGPIQEGFSVKAGKMTRKGFFVIKCQQEKDKQEEEVNKMTEVNKSEWKTIARPGWFGEAKNEKLAAFNSEYGEGNWRIRHQLGPRLLDLKESLRLYELCYELHFLNPQNRFLWTNLFRIASEVWTEEERDIESGLDYSIQQAKAPHYEDVSIRIIMQRYSQCFKGDRPIRIRADSLDAVGIALSSIHVPFIFPEFIESPFAEILWWNRHKGSLEEFWHTNKVLQIKTK